MTGIQTQSVGSTVLSLDTARILVAEAWDTHTVYLSCSDEPKRDRYNTVVQLSIVDELVAIFKVSNPVRTVYEVWEFDEIETEWDDVAQEFQFAVEEQMEHFVEEPNIREEEAEMWAGIE